MIKIGQGIDVYALYDIGKDKYDIGKDKQFVMLGGLKTLHTHSLKAHSQRDVVIHASADTMLSAMAMAMAMGSISIKATTTETLEFTGRQEGIMVSAVVLLTKAVD